MALASGTKLGPYEILAPLGAGGMGEVYRARDASLRRDVAIKLIPATFSRDSDRLRRFTQEAQSTAALNHPNILSIYQIGEHEGGPYIVSELLEGQTLRQVVHAGPLPVRRAIDYGTQVALGLAAAHGKGIVHRDLKPENIFVTKDGRVKILDFGLAKLTEQAPMDPGDSPTLTAGTEAGLVLGTAGYMSPEQIRGESVDPRSDIFSFGVVLYEMLAGQHAFRRKSGAETMAAILKEDPPPLDASRDVPPALHRILQHCLEKDPAARFQSTQDLAFDLDSVSSISSQQSRIETANPSRGWWKPVAIATSLLGALAIGAALRAHYSQISSPEWHRLAFSRGMISAARFAPDGQTILYSASWNGRPFDIYTTRPESPESRALGLQKSNLLGVSSRGELAVTRNIEVIGTDVFTGTLARVPLEGGTPREIMPSVQFADWARDGTTLAVVHALQGRHVLEYPPGHALAESGGQLAFPRISPAGDQIAYLEYPDPSQDSGNVVLVNQKGEKKILAEKWTDLTGLAWSPNGKEVWFTGTPTSNEGALYAVSLDARLRLLLTGPADLQLMDVAPDGRLLLAAMHWRAEMYGASTGDKAQRDLGGLDFPLPYDLSSDGRTLLFYEGGSGGGPNYTSYLQTMDGAPPLKLGEGSCTGISRDGDWVVCFAPQQPNPLVLIPTKAGTSRTLPKDQLTHTFAGWLPDGKRLLLLASEPGHAIRLYVQDIDGQPAHPISPEGITTMIPRLSPDGKRVAAKTYLNKIFVFPVDGGTPSEVPGIQEREIVAGWSQDSRSIYVADLGELPVHVYRVELASGKRELRMTLSPPDPTGVNYLGPILVAPDAKSYVYGLDRRLSNLYVVTGVK
ncbi:MAG: protein kinase [Candidatus Acidiferrales bacterium]